jgi:hypothetical protein
MDKKVYTMAKSNPVSKYVQVNGDEIVSPAQQITIKAREIAKDPQAVKELLFRTGMYDKNGKLKQEFR